MTHDMRIGPCACGAWHEGEGSAVVPFVAEPRPPWTDEEEATLDAFAKREARVLLGKATPEEVAEFKRLRPRIEAMVAIGPGMAGEREEP